MTWWAWLLLALVYMAVAVAVAWFVDRDRDEHQPPDEFFTGFTGLMWPVLVVVFVVIGPFWLVGWLASRRRR
jgi:hypothetical protein